MIMAMKESGIEWVGLIPDTWSVIPNKYVMHKEKNLCKKWTGEEVMSLTMNGVIVRDLQNPTGKMPATFDGYQYIEDGDLLMCLFDIDVTPRCVGKVTLHSNNLYQIFTYVKNRSYQFGEEDNTVSGMLLYAKTEEEIQPDNVYQMHGSQISVKTLDLNLPFVEIAAQMDRIVESHFTGVIKAD